MENTTLSGCPQTFECVLDEIHQRDERNVWKETNMFLYYRLLGTIVFEFILYIYIIILVSLEKANDKTKWADLMSTWLKLK